MGKLEICFVRSAWLRAGLRLKNSSKLAVRSSKKTKANHPRHAGAGEDTKVSTKGRIRR